MQAVVNQYQESRIGNAHVHLARFVGLLVVISATWAFGYISLEILESGEMTWTLLFIRDAILVGGIGGWLPAAVLTAAWAGAGGDRFAE